jgi:hypothetical protein
MSIAIKKKITAKEIYALFDAVARDKNQKDDPDLKDIDVNSFAREIHRHRIFWHNVIPLSDK